MPGFKFFVVCHSKKDSVNRGIERLAKKKYSGNFKKKVNILTSFSQIHKTLDSNVYIPQNYKKVMIDSGAYDFQIQQKAKFPYTPKQYFDRIYELHKNQPFFHCDYLVSMDYICEPHKKMKEIPENKKKIKNTIQNAIALKEIFEKEREKRDIDFEFVPVIQGYSTDGYKTCTRMLIKNNLIQDGTFFGVGSVAKRRNIGDIKDIVLSISQILKDQNISKTKMHLFGVNLNAVKNREIAKKIHSFDSFAWTFPYRFGRVKIFTGKRMIEANTENKINETDFYEISLRTTIDYINFLNFKLLDEKPDIYDYEIEQIIKDLENSTKNSKILKIMKLRKKKINFNEILVYTGEKFELFEPKNVKLSIDERYHIARFYSSLYLSTLKQNRSNLSKKVNEFTSFDFLEKMKEDKLILHKIINPIANYLELIKQCNKSLDRYNKENCMCELNLLNQIIPYLNYSLRKFDPYKNQVDDNYKNLTLKSLYCKNYELNYRIHDKLINF